MLRAANILTTLLHVALNPNLSTLYNLLIVASTFASAAWHASNEQNLDIGEMDYLLAGLWFTADTYASGYTLPLNLAVAAAHFAATCEQHPAWHLLSAAKAAFVSHYLLTG